MKYRHARWIPLFALILAVFSPASAPASHFRFGNLSSLSLPAQGQVEFRLTVGLRRDEASYGSFPTGVDAYAETGDVITDGLVNTAFNYGDGSPNSPVLRFVVTAYSTNENWLLAEALDPVTSARGIRHTYTGAGPFQAGIQSCCRLGPATLTNRADGSNVLRALIRPLTTNRSPVSSLVPIITVPSGNPITFNISALDPDGDTMRFRLANDALTEAGPCCSPPGFFINPNSGVVTWNNLGLTTNRFWTAQIIVEDLSPPGGVKSSSPVDFLLKIVSATNVQPVCALSPPGPFSVTFGTPLSFSVSGLSADPRRSVTLNSGGLPAGTSMTPTLPLSGPASGVASTFQWTPNANQIGTHPVLFTIADDAGGQSLCNTTITVTGDPTSDLAITKIANPSVAIQGSNITYTLQVNNLGQAQASAVSVTDLLPAGLSNVVAVPSRGSCTVQGGTVGCFLGNLAGGDSATIVLTAVATTSGTLLNTASVSARSQDSNTNNNTAIATVVVIVPTNLPPVIAITRPSDGAVLTTPPGIIPIEATAQDFDGTVQRVDYFSGAQFLGSATVAPYPIFWTNNVPGPYVITAIATDNQQATGTSAPVNIIIRTCDPALSAGPIPNQIRCLCDEVSFTVVANSHDPVTYAWSANGVLLPGETSATLTLKNLKPAQAGLYAVTISSGCAALVRSAMLTLKGAGNQNPVSFTNASPVIMFDNNVATPYPSALPVDCLPGPVKHLSVTLVGFSHNYPDDIDMLLASPVGAAVRLMSDAGGGDNVTNLVLTFNDTVTNRFYDSTMLQSGTYAPTDYETPLEAFPLPAPQSVTATNFNPFLGTAPNGNWSLFIRDDLGGDGGTIANGWTVTIEWQDTPPLLDAPQYLPDGSFQATLLGLPRMTHLVEASADLVNWEPVSTNTFTGPLVLTFNPPPNAPPHRFFRATRCP